MQKRIQHQIIFHRFLQENALSFDKAFIYYETPFAHVIVYKC